MRPLLFLLVSAAAFAAGPGDKMKLAYSDDFNGDAIDETKWTVGGRKDCVRVKDGKLILEVKDAGTEGFVGGHVVSKFKQMQGYWEAAIRFNAYKGHRGKFGINSDQKEGIPFGTILWEAQGDNSAARLVIWARLGDEKGSRDMKPDVKGNSFLPAGKMSKDFNRYGILWTDKYYQFYLNDKPVGKIDKAEIKKPASVRINHSVEEFDRPNLDPKILPDNVEVDWIKVYAPAAK